MTTYWKRVTYGDHREPPWILKEEPDRGLVAYAARDFAPGERICVEFPTLWIHGHHPFNEDQVKEILDKVEALCDEDKAAFYAMANVFEPSEYHPAVGIFMTNCFDMTDSIYGTCCAMYLALARLNHSCIPNAQQTHIPETTEEVLYASRFIAKGDEINDCYIDLRQPREKRREQLLEYYRFYCMCPGCTLPNSIEQSDNILEKDDNMRSQASAMIDDLTEIITEGSLPTVLRKAILFSKEIAKRDFLYWSVRYLPELYLCIYEIASTIDDLSTAKKYLEKAHKLNLLLQGPQSADSKRTAGLMQHVGRMKS